MDQFQYCENSRVIIIVKSISLSLAMEWIPARSYFNIADLPIKISLRRVPHVCSFYDIYQE